jgi:signal transduction histidine kinase
MKDVRNMVEAKAVRTDGKAVLSTYQDSIMYVNDTFLNLTGYCKNQLINRSAQEVIHNLLRATVDITNIKPEDEPITCFIFTRTLEPIEVAISKKVEFHEEIFIISEIPNSRLYEKIHDTDRMFSDNKMGICIISAPDLILLKANQFFLKMLNEPFDVNEKAIGHRIEDIVSDDMRNELFGKEPKDLINTKQSFYGERYTKIIRKGNKCFHNSMVIPYMQGDQVKYLIAFYIEVTEYVRERERAQEQKRMAEQQKEQLETILENMSDGLIITDKNQNVLIMNAAARAVYPDPDMSNNMSDWFKMINVVDQEGNPIAMENMPSHRAARGERVRNFRTNIMGPHGLVHVEYSSAPLYDTEGNISMIINCSRNVTEEVRSAQLVSNKHEQLLKAEMEKNDALKKAIKLKDDFLSLISHEFKTPITVIISAIQAMEHLCWEQFSDKARRFIGRIKQNAFRQLRLVNNLLEITKIESGQMKLKNGNYDIIFLASSITESVQEYANQKGLNLHFASPMKSKIMWIDDEKLERILLNLLSNAIKFTPKGRSIFVRVYQTDLDHRDMIALEVEDEGIGISEDKQKIIFEKFIQVDSSLTRQAEGTGLGLSLVKLFVEALDGVICLESYVGRGSKFTVYLPVQQVDLHPTNTQDVQTLDNRLIQSVKIEFSDLY